MLGYSLLQFSLHLQLTTTLFKMPTISKTLLGSLSNLKNSLLGASRVQGSYFSPDVDLKFVKKGFGVLETLGVYKNCHF